MKKYIRSIARRLNLPRDIKKRVIADLTGSIQERREAGQSDREIMAELGSPRQAAAELNEQMREYAFRKSPWRYLCLVLSGLAGAWLIWYWGLTSLFRGITLQESGSIGVIGGADGPTAIFVTTTGGFDWDIPIMVGLVILGILGYIFLCRLPGKKQ